MGEVAYHSKTYNIHSLERGWVYFVAFLVLLAIMKKKHLVQLICFDFILIFDLPTSQNQTLCLKVGFGTK
jgi:uncharacterized membrane protein YcaP (DUF421 family)